MVCCGVTQGLRKKRCFFNSRKSSSVRYSKEKWVRGKYKDDKLVNEMILLCFRFVLCIFIQEWFSNNLNSKPCGIRAARKLRVVRRQERWADKVLVVLFVFSCLEVQEGS